MKRLFVHTVGYWVDKIPRNVDIKVGAYVKTSGVNTNPPNVTGTVWFDNFIHVGRSGQWAGQNWNGFVDADSGWQYWIAPVGGNDGTSRQL